MREKWSCLLLVILLGTGAAYGADSKVTDMTNDPTPTGDDLLYTVNDPGGTPADRNATITSVLAIHVGDTVAAHAATAIGYTPAVGANWDDPDPDDAAEALDQLVARLSAHSALTGTSAHGAASTNTANAIVSRDGSGNFAAGTITATLTGNVTGNVTGSSGSTTGNAATATALAANGTNCNAGEVPLGVDASGAAEGCTDEYFTAVTFANLPAAGTVKRFIWVSDCESATNCDTGGGATYVLHYDDGSNWIPLFSSGVTPSLQQVGDVGRTLTADCSNPLKILHPTDSTTYWKICHDATDGLVIVPVVGGVEHAANKRVKLIDGKDWCILDNDDVCIFKLTEAGVFSGSAIKKTVEVVPFDFTTDVATGNGKFYFRVPTTIDGYSLSGVQVNVITAGTTNATTVGIDRCEATTSGNVCSGTVTDMLATVFSVDSGENSSSDAATPGALSGTPANLVVTAGQIIRINVDAVSTTAPKGMLVAMDFTAP